MNCKPGDLAIIRAPNPQYNGRIVEILYAAPVGTKFRLPCGTLHEAIEHSEPCWVVKFVGGRSLVAFSNEVRKPVLYAAGSQRAMFPLPGETEEEEIHSYATV